MDKLAQLFKKRSQRFLAIDFGRLTIKIAYLERLPKSLRLINYGLRQIPLSSGEREAAVIDFINDFLRTNSITDKEVSFSFSEPDSIAIKYLVLPALPKEEVLEAAKWQLKEEVPFELESALISWQLVSEHADAEGAKKNGIIFIAAKEDTVNKYLSIINKCGLSPARVSHSSFDYANILNCYSADSGTTAVLDIGYKGSCLNIYSNNKLSFVRVLPFSTDKITESLTGSLASDKGKIQLSLEEAKGFRDTFGIPMDTAQVINNITAFSVFSAMRPFLEGLSRELKLSFDYFNTNFNSQPPSRCYITGGGANLKNLGEYLNKELKMNVLFMTVPDCIDTSVLPKEGLQSSQNQIISVLGLGLSHSGSINLLPQELKTKEIENIEKVFFRLIAVTAGVIFLLSLFATRFQMREYNKRLKTAKAHLESMSKAGSLQEIIESRQGLILTIQESRVPVDGLLKVISVSLPAEVILSELSFDHGAHALFLKGGILAGENISEGVLVNFMQKLEKNPFFKEAVLVSSKKAQNSHEFEIKLDLAK